MKNFVSLISDPKTTLALWVVNAVMFGMIFGWVVGVVMALGMISTFSVGVHMGGSK